MNLTLEISDSILQVDAISWDSLVPDIPILSHAFLSALEDSGSVGSGTGWQPCPMLVHDDGQLVGAMPLYVKSHSYGEYVFDWAWAEAYQRSGLNYHPKLLSAIPFTPITCQRLLVMAVKNAGKIQSLMVDALEQIMLENQLSSVHVLFPDENSATIFKNAGWLQRNGVQFRWENENFNDFEDFLTRLSRDKRKKIRQERKKIDSSGVVCRRIKGADVTAEQWHFFYECYQNTYAEHRSTPYLTREFFQKIAHSMPQNILLVMAYLEGTPIAGALNIYNRTSLYGRYWGSMQYIPNLHFELCYYQAQEFCIAENIQYFEGGAQGEHKIARGFKPRATCSFHKIVDSEFSLVVQDFLNRESQQIAVYADELESRAPFKSM